MAVEHQDLRFVRDLRNGPRAAVRQRIHPVRQDALGPRHVLRRVRGLVEVLEGGAGNEPAGNHGGGCAADHRLTESRGGYLAGRLISSVPPTPARARTSTATPYQSAASWRPTRVTA